MISLGRGEPVIAHVICRGRILVEPIPRPQSHHREAVLQADTRYRGTEELPSCIHDELQETRKMVTVMIGQIRTMIFGL